LRRDLLIAAGPGEWRALWLEDDAAVELYVERGDIRPVGSIHLGRVVRRLAGLDAVLVDIGEERPGFLPLRPLPDEGARILVEVRREAQRGKGARLSTRLDPAAAARLGEEAARREPPAQLYPATGFAAALALRLPGPPKRVLADDAALLRGLREAFPAADVAHRAPDDWPADPDAVFALALVPSVGLPGGGSLHIEERAAAVLIDVDTGTPEGASLQRTALTVNLAATEAIARQMRLRQLGGGIVVDFAALDGRRARERVRQAMEEALAGDPARPQVLGWSRLGHLEIVRPRHARPLSAAMLEPAGVRKTAAALAFEALRALYREARIRPAADWRLLVAPGVAAVLQGAAAQALRGLETRLGRTVQIVVAQDRNADPFDIAPV
jgi:Ribonuclease G/E